MATGIVEGLFGITPESYQQQQADRAFSEAANFAQLTPFQQAGTGIMYGAGQLTRGLMGTEDPQLTIIRNRQQLLRGLDASDPDALIRASMQASSSGDQMLALQLADRAKTLQSALAEQAQKAAAARSSLASAESSLASARKSAFEIGDVSRTQKLAETGKYTPDSIGKYIESGNVADLVAIDKLAKPVPEFVAKAVELGFGDKGTYGGYTPDQVKAINASVMKDELDKRAAGASVVRLNVSQKQEEEFSKKRGVTQAQALDDAANLARGASQALATLNNMKQLNATGELFTGPLANSYITGTNFLASVGLLSPAQTRVLTSSEVYDKQAKDLVMQDLGGKLGAQISDADRKFVEARIPQITTSVKARTELLNKLDEIQRNKIDYYRKMNSHANEFGNLNKFDFAEQYSPIQAPSAGVGTRENPIKLK